MMRRKETVKMDNRVFNMNGTNDYDDLLEVLKLAFKHGNFGRERTAKGWVINQNGGFILYSYVSEFDILVNKFPLPLSAESVYPMIKQYLEDETAWTDTSFEDWDKDAQHDGHNTKGWRVYCEGWGHIQGHTGAFIAIRPAYMWMGK